MAGNLSDKRELITNKGKPVDINVHKTTINYNQTVGIISLSQIGRKMVDLLQHFGIDIIYSVCK